MLNVLGVMLLPDSLLLLLIFPLIFVAEKIEREKKTFRLYLTGNCSWFHGTGQIHIDFVCSSTDNLFSFKKKIRYHFFIPYVFDGTYCTFVYYPGNLLEYQS